MVGGGVTWLTCCVASATYPLCRSHLDSSFPTPPSSPLSSSSPSSHFFLPFPSASSFFLHSSPFSLPVFLFSHPPPPSTLSHTQINNHLEDPIAVYWGDVPSHLAIPSSPLTTVEAGATKPLPLDSAHKGFLFLQPRTEGCVHHSNSVSITRVC